MVTFGMPQNQSRIVTQPGQPAVKLNVGQEGDILPFTVGEWQDAEQAAVEMLEGAEVPEGEEVGEAVEVVEVAGEGEAGEVAEMAEVAKAAEVAEVKQPAEQFVEQPPVPSPEFQAKGMFKARLHNAEQTYIECSENRKGLADQLKTSKKREELALEVLRELKAKGWQQFVERFLSRDGAAESSESAEESLGEFDEDGEPTSLPPSPAAKKASGTTRPLPIVTQSTTWESAPLADLGLPPALQEKLEEAGIHTMGELTAFRAKVADRHQEWPKGVGKKKIDLIEDAVEAWLAKGGASTQEVVAPTAVPAVVVVPAANPATLGVLDEDGDGDEFADEDNGDEDDDDLLAVPDPSSEEMSVDDL